MSRRDVDAQIAELAAVQAGTFSLRQVRSAGGDRVLAHRRVAAGRWGRLARGVFVLSGTAVTRETQLWAGHLEAGPGSAICLRAAAQRHGFWGNWGDAVEVTRREGRDTRLVLSSLHETSRLPSDHIVPIDGLPTTSVARTVFDLAGDPPPALRWSEAGRAIYETKMRRLCNEAMARHGLSVASLKAVLVVLGKRGRSGTALIRRLLEEFGEQYVPTESELEDLFLSVIRSFGIEEPDRQVVLGDDNRLIGRVDFVWRWARLVVEVDGLGHDEPGRPEADRWRDNQLQAAGWQVLRVRLYDLLHQPARVAQLIKAALARAA